MISQENFDRIEMEHGCGYWNMCWEHVCPCAITTENKGLTESIYNGFVEENRKISEEFNENEFNEEMEELKRIEEIENMDMSGSYWDDEQ